MRKRLSQSTSAGCKLLGRSGVGSAGAANLNSALVLIHDLGCYEPAPNQAEHKGKVHFRAALICIT